MKRSEHRILTTHVGSLSRPADLLASFRARAEGTACARGSLRATCAHETTSAHRPFGGLVTGCTGGWCADAPGRGGDTLE